MTHSPTLLSTVSTKLVPPFESLANLDPRRLINSNVRNSNSRSNFTLSLPNSLVTRRMKSQRPRLKKRNKPSQESMINSRPSKRGSRQRSQSPTRSTMSRGGLTSLLPKQQMLNDDTSKFQCSFFALSSPPRLTIFSLSV